MPALYHSPLEGRSQSGELFSIIFSIFVVTVFIACAIWGIIPILRKRQSGNLSNVRWTHRSSLRGRRGLCRRFPAHSGLSQQSLLPTYNPRIETPFPNCPGNHSDVSVVLSRTNSAPATITSTCSNGLFTPVRSNIIQPHQARSDFHTVPRGPDAKCFKGKSFDFGDAKDFILAVPEPLVLKQRPDGRPPAVVRHLQKYGTPHSNSPANSDKHLHPNKLFRALQKDDVRSSYCSSTTMRIDWSESDPTTDRNAIEMVKVVGNTIRENSVHKQDCHDNDETSSVFNTSIAQDEEQSSRDPSLTALHRLRSYRSLTGSEPLNLTRARTLTRSRAPTSDLRRAYGNEERSVTLPCISTPRQGTISTVTTRFEASSDIDSTSTPATSPTLQAGNLGLLPTPLRPRRNIEHPSDSDILKLSVLQPISSNTTYDEDDGDLPSLQLALGKKREQRISRGFYHTGRRNKPAPPNINTDLKKSATEDDWPLRSNPDVDECATSSAVSRDRPRQLIRASSMYSRDTLGMSLMRTPTTADKTSPLTIAFSESDGTTSVSNPFRSRESIKSRINEWNQRTEGVPPTPQLSKFKNISPAASVASIRDQFEAPFADDKRNKSCRSDRRS